MRTKEYALYKGEELLATGTKREIAKQLGVSPSTVGYYGTPVYARRTSENGRRLVEIRNTRLSYITTIWKTVSMSSRRRMKQSMKCTDWD